MEAPGVKTVRRGCAVLIALVVDEIPQNARHAARVILLDDDERILYFHAEEPKTGRRFWVMPGGGLHRGEGFEEAASRETYEETGIRVVLGPCVWTRRHIGVWNGKRFDQYERFFVARAPQVSVAGSALDDYIVGHRWWTYGELRASAEEFAPRKIRDLLPPILQGELPDVPLDCGV